MIEKNITLYKKAMGSFFLDPMASSAKFRSQTAEWSPPRHIHHQGRHIIEGQVVNFIFISLFIKNFVFYTFEKC